MRHLVHADNFLQTARNVAYYQNGQDTDYKLSHYPIPSNYNTYKKTARERKLDFNISEDEF
jgi:hypothetical protein